MNHNRMSNRHSLPAEQLAELTNSLSRCCQAKDNETFAQFGLSIAEGQFLLVVAERGTLSPSEAAESLGVCRSRMTPLAQSLIAKGLLARRESKTDRRARTLSLTARGKDVSRAAACYRREFHERLMTRFSAEEQLMLLNTLASLRDQITEVRRETTALKSKSERGA